MLSAGGEFSRELVALVGKERRLGGGVGSVDGPKKLALSERGGARCSIRGVSSSVVSSTAAPEA